MTELRRAGQALPDWVDWLPETQQEVVKSLYNECWNPTRIYNYKAEMTYRGWGTLKYLYVDDDGRVSNEW